MISRLGSRRYEIAALRGNRWLIDCLAETEQDARRRADVLYADDSVDAVRVVRARFGHDGSSYETVILERAREAGRGAAPIRLSAGPSEAALCETAADLYGSEGRRIIAEVLRNFLDRYGLTPTELLHHHRYIRLLERQDALLPQALQRIAAHQARAHGVDARVRLDALDRLVHEASQRAREALQSSALSGVGDGGLVALAEQLASRANDPAVLAFDMRFAVSRTFEDINDVGGKMERVIGWASVPLPSSLMPLVDELLSGLLGSASLIQHVLGPQPHLAAAMSLLAEVVAGRSASAASPPASMKPLAGLLAEADMPETRRVLIDRLVREIASDKPLSRADAVTQRRQFERLLDSLLDRRGLFVGGAAMVDAIARRSRRLDIVGAIEAVRFACDDAPSRLAQLLEIPCETLAERQQRALATYFADILARFRGDPRSVLPLRPRIESFGIPDALKRTLLDCLPAPDPLARPHR